MPHTSHPSHRKRPTPKRTQVTDDDGWTHVASGGNVRRVMRTRPRGTTEIKESESGISSIHPEEPTLTPAEAPGRLTLSELQAQFQTHRERWEGSESWTKLTSVLDERLKRAQEQASTSDATSSAPARCPVDAIVCIGLGSPSGFLRDGWVDRRSVSLYQLAALASIKDQVACTTSSNLKVYAQDPVFNTLDESLLAALNITVIKHPEAFSHITANTMLFCPGAERKHLELLLPSKPWLLFGGPLEHADSDGVLQGYVDGAGSYCLPVFEALEHAFWNMRLYWVEDVVGEE
ncbi:Sensitivity To Red Light Reduced-like, SRR1 [Penicillium expansum]|uniref:Sensitivity To Red Light Reduced-like, SRR1 n=1 Tax=Penicillium expansum TaxID=27334 RepID=A0A0A2KW25_PENEN|nr:Sensitivity To Red Light Reduced-like, SRR1 [Penicillium expansum]KGO44626.1 Sensitivity To Red Light Reduced-like, SRR1 [Penicillium expansum]KGO56696.1 Sensitivity To Red Light Reduced-like, SRR1 [Penicillium expansum]KGO72004.1 Sensitivity To Red Light Reduced-like, SRR1 [Penicillium expansum]